MISQTSQERIVECCDNVEIILFVLFVVSFFSWLIVTPVWGIYNQLYVYEYEDVFKNEKLMLLFFLISGLCVYGVIFGFAKMFSDWRKDVLKGKRLRIENENKISEKV